MPISPRYLIGSNDWSSWRSFHDSLVWNATFEDLLKIYKLGEERNFWTKGWGDRKTFDWHTYGWACMHTLSDSDKANLCEVDKKLPKIKKILSICWGWGCGGSWGCPRTLWPLCEPFQSKSYQELDTKQIEIFFSLGSYLSTSHRLALSASLRVSMMV